MKIYLRNLITSHIIASQIRPINKVNTTGIKPIATGKRITLSQGHDAIGAIFASFMITNTMKHTVPIPIPLFDEVAVTALFAISPPNLKMPDIISIRQDIPRVILTPTVYIQLLDGFRDHRI